MNALKESLETYLGQSNLAELGDRQGRLGRASSTAYAASADRPALRQGWRRGNASEGLPQPGQQPAAEVLRVLPATKLSPTACAPDPLLHRPAMQAWVRAQASKDVALAN